MKYARYISRPDLDKVDANYVSSLVDMLYRAHEERRAETTKQHLERRGPDRRTENKVVFLDTRCSQSRRRQDGRRWQDKDDKNTHKRGIDYYV